MKQEGEKKAKCHQHCEREAAGGGAVHWRWLCTRGHSEIADVEGKIDHIGGSGKGAGTAGGVGTSPVNNFLPPPKGDLKISKPVLENQNILLTKHLGNLEMSTSPCIV